MLEVYAYNAGKGDCIRIRFGEGHNIFVDSGVIRFAKSFIQICSDIIAAGEKLDVLILTHVDDDHIGGILSFLRANQRCPFDEVWMNHTGKIELGNALLSTRQNDEVYARLLKQNINVKRMLKGDCYTIDAASITTLSPAMIIEDNRSADVPLAYYRDVGLPLSRLSDMPIQRKDSSISNKNSIVFIFEYRGKRILFTGDAWAEDIVSGLGDNRQKFDLIKLPHHGSVGNISENLLEQVDCNDFLICADGRMHPDKQTIAKLLKGRANIRVYSPVAWWEHNFFMSNDNIHGASFIRIQQEGKVCKWQV